MRTLENSLGTRLTPYLLACLVWGIVNAAPVPHPTDGLTARRENYTIIHTLLGSEGSAGGPYIMHSAIGRNTMQQCLGLPKKNCALQ